jgi:hypothetical protein
VGEVLPHQSGQDQFGDLDELDGLAGYVYSFPPADVGVKSGAEVVLVYLPSVQRPAVVFVLPYVKQGSLPSLDARPPFSRFGLKPMCR